MRLNKALTIGLMTAGAALIVTGCGPKYPKCDNDENCAEKGEFCVNGLCQQCRDNSHCKEPGNICVGGKCELKPGYCDDTHACPGDQVCRNNQCGPQCLGNDDCKDANTFCNPAGRCQQRPECGENAATAECPAGKDCKNGTCVEPERICRSEPVFFDFDKAAIRADQRAKLDGMSKCLKQEGFSDVLIEGHCDERGTAEYNIALGDRRADATKRYLVNTGVKPAKLTTKSMGEERPAVDGHDESAWSKNRRTEFVSP